MTVNPLILHLPRRVAPPARAWRDLFALHQEGVRGQYRAVTDGHVVVDEGTDSDSAAIADRGSTGLEGAVLLRLALDHAALIEDALVPDDGQRRLGDVEPVV